MPFGTITYQTMVCVGWGKKRSPSTNKAIPGVGFAFVNCHLCHDGETFQTFCKLFGWFGTRAGPGVG